MPPQCSCRDRLQNNRTYSTVLVIVLFIANEAFMTAVVPVSPEILLQFCYLDVYSSTDRQQAVQAGLLNVSELYEEKINSKGFNHSSNDCTTSNTTTTTGSSQPVDPLTALLEECNARLSITNGILLATTFIMRILLTVPSSLIVDKIGVFWPLFSSSLLIVTACLMYGFAGSVVVLFISRAFHGIGGAGLQIAGISCLTLRYADDERKKGFVLGLVISGFAFGAMIGPTLGSVMYGLVGQSAAFLVLFAVFLPAIVFIPLVIPMDLRPPATEWSSTVFAFVTNRYSLLVSLLGLLTTMGLAYMNATLPIWLRTTKETPEWQVGLIFIPASVMHMISGPLVGYWNKKLKRWRCMFIGATIMAIGIATLPLCNVIWQLIPSVGLIGLAFGSVDSTTVSIMYRIVDAWYEGANSTAAAVFVFEFCLAYAIGTLTSGTVYSFVGFNWTMWSLSIAILICSPLSYFLGRIPEEEDKETPRSTNGDVSLSNLSMEPDNTPHDEQLNEKRPLIRKSSI